MKFCGMCGKALTAPEPVTVSPPSMQSSSPGAFPSSPEETPFEAPRPSNAPAPAHTGGLFKIGTHDDEPSRNLDYLLEDDEPRSGSKLIWIGLAILALVVAGVGYWHYRNGGWNAVVHNKGADVTPATGANPSDNPVGQPSDSTPSATGTPAPNPPATKDAAITDVHPRNPASSSPEVLPQPPASTPAPPRDEKPAPPTEKAAAPAKPHNIVRPDSPPKAEDPVTLGESFLYGKNGAPQSCERGLKLVKPAADQANTRAMITMGALYATGHCLARDLPTAYRFFALALRKDPENAALKQNVEMVWSQMTASERQQAIRLTQ
jgi:hypothetical protein